MFKYVSIYVSKESIRFQFWTKGYGFSKVPQRKLFGFSFLSSKWNCISEGLLVFILLPKFPGAVAVGQGTVCLGTEYLVC